MSYNPFHNNPAQSRKLRANERTELLSGMTPEHLLSEVSSRIGAFATENAKLREQVREITEKGQNARTLDAHRVSQIQNLEKTRSRAEERVREFRSRLGQEMGYTNPVNMPDERLIELIQKKIQILLDKTEDLEVTASEQEERLAEYSKTVNLIFGLVYEATGVRNEGLTVSEAVEKLTAKLRETQRSRDKALDRESLMESELEEARQNNAQMADAIEAMRKEVVELRTAQAPRWYPVGTSPEVRVNETTRRSDLEDYSIQVPEARSYVWLDRDRDPWTWSTELGEWKSYRKDGSIREFELAPDKIHGPYECAGLIRPVVDSPETLNNLSTSDDQRWSRSYKWVDRDGDAWVWVPVVNEWLCVGHNGENLADQDTSLRPSSEHGPYQRGERVSG